jgi:hypothetical protein
MKFRVATLSALLAAIASVVLLAGIADATNGSKVRKSILSAVKK